VGNAVKFTKRGGVTIQFQIADGRVRCEVTDTGPGIPAEMHGLLFREFSQIASVSGRQSGGTGLGLVISKRLAELMGGKIGFTSKVGGGSTFWFTLPAHVPVPAGRPGGSVNLPIDKRVEAKATVHPAWPSFTSPEGKAIRYGRECCPRTLDILSRYAGVTMNPRYSDQDLSDIIRAIRKVYTAMA